MRDLKGVWTFDAQEVESLRRGGKAFGRPPRSSEEGRIAARVFEMFEEGYDLPEVVIAARQRPALIRELYAEWRVGLEDGEHARRMADDEARFERALRQEERDWERIAGKR